MNEFMLYASILILSVLISSVSQILLKLSAKTEHTGILQEYLNPKVLFAYFLFFTSTVLTMVSYRVIPLSLGPVLEATGYFWVAILGLVFLKEKVNRRKWLGILVILIGIIVFNF